MLFIHLKYWAADDYGMFLHSEYSDDEQYLLAWKMWFSFFLIVDAFSY
jgi:hypothetical protein